MNTALFRSPRVWMSAALLLGWFASAYLLYEYVTGGPIACGSAGCDIVRASDWAYVGPIPLPLFGVVFYTTMFALLVARSIVLTHAKLLRTLTFIGATIGLLESISLFFVQWLDVRAFCVWCLVSASATLIVWLLAWFDHPVEQENIRSQDLLGYAVVLGVFVVVAIPAFLFLTYPELLLRA